MTASLHITPSRATSSNGLNLDGARWYFYQTGTTTPQSVYTTAALSTPHTNPVVADAAGKFANIYFDASLSYRGVLKSSDDVTIIYDIDPINTDTFSQLAASSGSSLVSFLQAGTGAVARTAQAKMREVVSAKDYGAAGDGVADDTTEIQAAIDYCIANGKALEIPPGTYLFSSLTGLDENNIVIRGAGSGLTILKHTGTGIALDLGTSAAFRQGMDISGFTIEGNSNTTTLFRGSALARCQFTDINLREANGSTGIGMVLRGCMLNRFTSIMCSQDRQSMTNAPTEGLNIEALSPFGNSTNNVFEHCYFEGAGTSEPTIDIGIRISGGDQNVFIGGSPESCKTYGLLISTTSRFNTFIGTGFENLNATADISDGGVSTKYINCYASQKVIIQGRQIEIAGGFYERIQIDSGAKHNCVTNVTINYWSTGSGGFVDNGDSTFVSSVYDHDATAFIYPLKDRTGITPTGSPYTWTNTTGQFVDVVIQAGTVTQVRIKRGADAWLVSASIPNRYLLAPTDQIEVSYSVDPAMSYVPFNHFQG